MRWGCWIARSSLYFAEHRLLASGQNVVARCAYVENLPNRVFDAALQMGVEAECGEGPLEKQGVGYRVGDAHLRKRCEARERVIEVVRPIEGTSSGAETFFAVAGRGVAGQYGAEVE